MYDQTNNETMLLLSGNTLSPGMGRGRAFIYRDTFDRQDEFYDIEEFDIKDEVERLHQAVAMVSADLGLLAERVSDEMDDALSGIFRAHVAMVQDPSLNAEVVKEIEEELVSAGSAVKIVFRRWVRRFQKMELEVARHKADDVRDLARRLISSLAGVRAHALEKLPEGSVLVARRLLPSDTIFLARKNISAAILEHGGTSSHAALFAREIGLACITGVKDAVDQVPAGALALVDADSGKVIVHPEKSQQHIFDRRFDQLKRDISSARTSALQPAVTMDGERIAVYANVACAEDTRQALKNGSEGIGLYRVEQVYLGRQTPPDEKALLEEVSKTLEPAKHLPVYVRLLDVGADKPMPFMESFRETNPALGQRGIRFLQAYPDLLRTQLKVLLQLSVDYDLHILVPMVTFAEDIKAVREQLYALASEKGISPPKLGAMIETPAAAMSVSDIAEHADFMSFGTNDLTQYTFAADRENASVERYFDDAHKVIFRYLGIAQQDLPNMPFSVCGELAGRPEQTSKLIRSGIKTLSVAPPMIPIIKQGIRAFQC